jgi:hypothetical protein
MPLDDLYLLLTAYLPDQIPDPVRHILPQDRFPILGDPHQMQVDHEYRMRAVPIFRHNGRCTKSVLKLPPKGGGFNPPKVKTISGNLAGWMIDARNGGWTKAPLTVTVTEFDT